MIRIIGIIYFLFIAEPIVNAQADTNISLIKTIPITGSEIAVDNLQNFYILNDQDQLIKYNSDGDSVAVYNQTRRFGKVHSLEVTNPLKILLFYKDYSTIAILDRFLTERGTIDLRRSDILQPTSMSLSYDNNIWVFDAFDNKLKKIDEHGKLLMETSDLRSVFTNAIKPSKIINYNNRVYLYDAEEGVFIFDHYGTLQRKIPIKRLENFFVYNQFILGVSEKRLVLYNISKHEEKVYKFSSTSFSKYFISGDNLYILNKASIYIFRIQY